ncbi:MAG: two-component system, response regulator PdtaR [Clostridiales bacterium]|jgi:response regulator NasT|nr:two-component system, response regulator PdtaR [Clostridiales bacterium]MDN5298042.1 two-component system, response regulator PdtaR [Clostridiales bacterium]
MERILVVSSSENSQILCRELLSSFQAQIVNVGDGSEARRTILNQSFDLILINAPLKDEFGHELAAMFSQKTTAGIILLIKSELCDQISERVEDYGVVCVPKPISKSFFFQAVKIVSATSKRLVDLQNENIRLQHKIEDMRMVDRAKYALIKYLNFSEPQAHRYIEKHAMDMRISKREVAENIIKTYDTWRDPS